MEKSICNLMWLCVINEKVSSTKTVEVENRKKILKINEFEKKAGKLNGKILDKKIKNKSLTTIVRE